MPRKEVAEKVIREKNKWLQCGEYLDGEKRIMYSEEIPMDRHMQNLNKFF